MPLRPPLLRRLLLPLLLATLLLSALAALLVMRPPGYTRLELTDADSGRLLLAAVLADGEAVTLTWQNSIYNLPVVEVFYAQDGQLIQDEVTFLEADGSRRNPVTAADVQDLYHTGGAFSATGLARPFREIIYRIGEIGDPQLTVQGRSVALKQEVGFGGRVRLRMERPRGWQVIGWRVSQGRID